MRVPSLPEVMILSTYHMANPNLDVAKTNYADVLAEDRQAQIREVVGRLVKFAPTHVVVEARPERMPVINERFRQYIAGEYTLTRNEIDQVGFRVARAMGHDRLYGIDFWIEMGYGPLMAYVEEQKMTDLMEQQKRFIAEMEERPRRIEETGSILDLLRYFNSPEHDGHHREYLRMAPVGDGENFVGADMVAAWYTRNLKMYALLARIAANPGDRLFVLVGAGHGHLLREFVRQGPHFDLVDPAPYLA